MAQTQPERVLIVDDEPAVREYADRLFSEKGTLWEHEAFLEKPSTIDGILEGVRLLLRTRNGDARNPIPVSHRRLISMSTPESLGSATT